MSASPPDPLTDIEAALAEILAAVRIERDHYGYSAHVLDVISRLSAPIIGLRTVSEALAPRINREAGREK